MRTGDAVDSFCRFVHDRGSSVTCFIDMLLRWEKIPPADQEALRQKAYSTSPIDAFDRFWGAYPRKIGKEAARKSWKRIKPDAMMLEKMLSVIGLAKKSDQWKSGFIPNPATWLNQGRWDDVIELGPPSSGPKPSYDLAEIEAMIYGHGTNRPDLMCEG